MQKEVDKCIRSDDKDTGRTLLKLHIKKMNYLKGSGDQCWTYYGTTDPKVFITHFKYNILN